METEQTFKKVTIQRLSNDIREAAKIIQTPLKHPGKDEILVRNCFSGVNAIDMNIITGRSKMFNGILPIDAGMEVCNTLGG